MVTALRSVPRSRFLKAMFGAAGEKPEFEEARQG